MLLIFYWYDMYLQWMYEQLLIYNKVSLNFFNIKQKLGFLYNNNFSRNIQDLKRFKGHGFEQEEYTPINMEYKPE